MVSESFDRLKKALVDRYAIERELGRGGMATVYLARDVRHERLVALKVLRPDLAATLGTERFLREVKIAASLSHPHILPLYDSGEADGFLYYVMPYVEGESLRTKLDREHELPLTDVVRILRDMVDALAYAHQQQVVHRDIKPDNVMLTDRHALVTDFGIAKAVSEATGRQHVTTVGVALGTPTYMAPEQAAADPNVDHRADIYALGVLGYELLAGRPPFTGTTAQELLAAHVMSTPDPVTDHRTVVPPVLANTIMRCLEKKPADRWQSADDLLRTLEPFATSDEVSPVGTRPVAAVQGGPRRKWLGLGIAAAILLVATGWWFRSGSAESNVVTLARRIAVLPFTPTGPDTALARLGRDLTVTLSANLDGVGDITTADAAAILSRVSIGDALEQNDALELARQFGAGTVLQGTLVRAGDAVRADATLLAADDGQAVARLSVTGAPGDFNALTDSLAWSLLRQVWRGDNAPSPRLAAVTTTSLDALRAFLEGEAASVESRWPAAADAYTRALAADSTFWLALGRLRSANGWLNRASPPGSLARLREHRHALPERERRLVEVGMAGSATAFAERLDAMVRAYPRYAPAWIAAGEAAIHWRPWLGFGGAQEVVDAFERVMELSPRHTAALEHSLGPYLFLGDTANAARVIDSLYALGARQHFIEGWGWDPLTVDRLMLDAMRNGVPDSALLDSVSRTIAVSRPYPDPDQSAFMASSMASVGFPVVQVAVSRRVLELTPHRDIAHSHRRALAWAWANRGAFDSALVTLDAFASEAPEEGFGLDAYRIAVLATWLGGVDVAEATRRRAGALREVDTVTAGHAEIAWLDGVLALHQRSTSGIAAARDRIPTADSVRHRWLVRSLNGFEQTLTETQLAPATTLADLEEEGADVGPLRGRFGSEHAMYSGINRLLASRMLVVAGDTARALRALRWQETVYQIWNIRAMRTFTPLAFLEQARIEEAAGRVASAREHYQQFLRWWDMPMPGLRHLVEEAEAARARSSGIILEQSR